MPARLSPAVRNHYDDVRNLRDVSAIHLNPQPELLDAIHAGIERDRAGRQDAGIVARLRERFAALTSREREIMAHVVTGRLNKQIAGDLHVSEITVKVHRGHIMRKMGAKSLAELVRMADEARCLRGKIVPKSQK